MADQPSSIFGNTDTSTQTNTQTPVNSNTQGVQTNNDFADLLSSIKNERGEQKYKSLEDALNGLKNAQEYIPNVKQQLEQKEQELQRMREETQRLKTLEETVAALTSQREEQVNTQTSAPVFDENKLAEIVNQQLSRKEQAQVAQSNIATVTAALQQSFGADAEKKFYDKATEMGMTQQEMNMLAAKSPKAVLAMLGVNAQVIQRQTIPTQGTVNTGAFTPQENTFVGRNPNSALVGATSNQVNESMIRAKKMVDELHAKGMTVHDLSDPKIYNKFFK